MRAFVIVFIGTKTKHTRSTTRLLSFLHKAAGSGLEGSVEHEEVDITVKVRSDFRFQVLILVLKVMDGRFNFL